MHLYVLQILTERSFGRRVDPGRDRPRGGPRVEAKQRSAVAIWTKHAAVEISMCRGCEKHTYRSRRRAGARSADGSRPLAGGHSLSTTRPTIDHRIVGPRDRMPWGKGRVSSPTMCDLHALPPMSALRHDPLICR